MQFKGIINYYVTGIPGVAFLLFLFPIISYILTNSLILSGILFGLVLTPSIFFHIKLRFFELPKLGSFSSIKSIVSIFVVSSVVSYFLGQLNVEVNISDFTYLYKVFDDIFVHLLTDINIENKALFQLLLLHVKISAIALAVISLIKLFIYTFVTNVVLFIINYIYICIQL